MSGLPSCAAGVPIFGALPADALSDLSRSMRHRRCRRGECIASAGEPVDALVVVAGGRLKLVHTTSAGREQVVRTLGPGDFLGELALMMPAVHEGDLMAAVPSEVCLIPRAAVQALLHRYPESALRLVEHLALRLADAERLIADLSLRDVGQRLAAALVRLAESSGEPDHEGVRLRVPVPWSDMALLLGTTPESLSRRLATLADQGVLRQERARTVLILDPDRLRDLAGNPSVSSEGSPLQRRGPARSASLAE